MHFPQPQPSSCLSDPKTHGRGVLAIVADADESFLVLDLAPDDGHWGALAVRVVLLLTSDGDVVPGQRSVGVSFDDGLLGCEPGSAGQKIQFWGSSSRLGGLLRTCRP